MTTSSQFHADIRPSNTENQILPSSERGSFALMELVINSLSQKSDRIKILSKILPHILTLDSVEQGALLVVGDEAHRLTAVIKQKLPDEVIRQFTGGELGQELLTGKQIYLASQTSQINPEQTLLNQYKLKYLLALPLRFQEEILGGLVISSSKDFLHPESQRQLESLAHLMALFLDHIRLRTQLQRQTRIQAPPPSSSTARELEELLAAIMLAEEEVVYQNKDLGILNTLSHEIGSALQLDVILEAAVKRTRLALNTDIGWFYVYEDGILVLREYQGLSEQYVRELKYLRPGNGVEGMAFNHRRPIFRDALLFHSGQTRAVVETEGLRSVAAIPLLNRAGDNALGVLAVGDRSIRQWSSRDERMLVLIGRQVALAVANAQVFTETQKKAATWEAKFSTIQESNAQLTQRSEILEQQLQTLRRVERQIWVALAASQQARRSRWQGHHPPSEADEQLMVVLKKALETLGKHEETEPPPQAD